MHIGKATILYFSGTKTTEKYAQAFTKGLSFETEVKEIRHDAQLAREFGSDELLVLACPVFGGYAPAFVWEQLEGVRGANTPAVALAVYGARDYDNALLEMSAKLGEAGFVTVGAAALVARHSIVQSIAPERPTNADLDEAAAFAATVAERLAGMGSIADAPSFAFKGELGGTGPKNPAPLVSDDCVECGTCARQCPAGAIPADEPNTTDAEKCLTCLRCVAVCPMSARSLPQPMLEGAAAMLAPLVDPEKANELF